MVTNEIREKFLSFFKERQHTVVPSDSLVPSGDPTLLFTSAGMVQFKNHFLGHARLSFSRATSCQKCLRTSDIDQVGTTGRHLTFFEMLGNFSFGDYFKKEAIEWGWEFLTRECQLTRERLYASVYKEDEESYNLWKKILPESKIARLNEETNFWNMGATGPCGPCSEILLDRGEKTGCGKQSCGPGCDCERYLEVWNLVFTQFDKQADGKLLALPQKNIDTGMGLERLSAVVNGYSSNFEMDLFQSLIHEIKKLLPQKRGSTPQHVEQIIADHVRSCAFLISDGILPSNEGRGYILRRLLRRALRCGWVHERKEPFLYLLAPIVSKEMGKTYPELLERCSNIQAIIETEEKNALQTIETGTRYLEDVIRDSQQSKGFNLPLGKVTLPGEKVFYIYDTFGLDSDIQKEIVKDWNGELLFSKEDYEKAKEKAIQTARKGWKGSGEKENKLYSEILKKCGSTIFKGYEVLECETKVMAILKRSNEQAVLSPTLEKNEEGEIVLAQTPFYAESGGQVGDQGVIEEREARGVKGHVLDTQKPVEGLIVHRINMRQGKIAVGDAVIAKVNAALRKHTMRHHTATHLLHAALRKICGPHVTQAGSLVSPEKLRFDFTHPRPLTPEEIAKIESEVNNAVCANINKKRSEHALEDARKEGALAFFGDKYGDKVFVVRYDSVSAEVCGGTHCLSTGEIGFFKMTSESSIGSGVRRVEAVAGEKALAFVQKQEQQSRLIAEKLKCSLSESLEKIDKIVQRQTELESEIAKLKRKSRDPEKSNLADSAKSFLMGSPMNGNLKIVAEEIESLDPQTLRETADSVRDKLGSGIVLIATRRKENVSFVITVTQDCVKKGFHAGEIAKLFSEKIGGKGGGKESFAQGGGKSVHNLKKILESFPKEIIKGRDKG